MSLRGQQAGDGEIHRFEPKDTGEPYQPIPVGGKDGQKALVAGDRKPGLRDPLGVHRRGQGDHGADAVGHRLVGHGGQVEPGRSVAAAKDDVVGAPHQEDPVRLFAEHIPAEPGEHAAGGVPVDTPVHQGMAGGLRRQAHPAVPAGDAVAVGEAVSQTDQLHFFHLLGGPAALCIPFQYSPCSAPAQGPFLSTKGLHRPCLRGIV